MAITKRQGKNGISYRVTVDFGSDPVTGKRRQRTETYRTKKEAESREREWLTEIERGTAVDGTKMTTGEYLQHWLESSVQHTVRKSTYKSYAHLVKNHLVPSLGSIPLQKLQPVQVQAFYGEKLHGGRADGQKGGLSPRTVRYLHTVLREALHQAVKWGMVARNVCDATDPPRAVRPDVKAWAKDEARKFLEVAEQDPWNPLWLVALTTGLRRGELLGIRWQDVDLAKGTLHVRQSLNAVGGLRYFEAPKTAAGRRVVALSGGSVAALKAHRVRQNERRLQSSSWQDCDLVFTGTDGGPLWPDDVSHRFKALTALAEVVPIRLHDLRHTHATLLLKEGVHLKIVSERLGHTGIQITADVYSHVTPDMQQGAAQRIDDALFGT
jgi:integrase